MRTVLVLAATTLLVLVGVVAGASVPKLAFQTNYTSDLQTYGIYSSPRGVNEGSSPFVMFNSDSLQSFSASGKLLRTRKIPTSQSFSMMVTPLMNIDANEKTLFVAPLQNGTITAIVAETLKTKWSYTAAGCNNEFCSVTAMLYVEPQLASCPSGAGGVSVIMCPTENTCTTSMLDIDSGHLCSNVTTIPPKYRFNGWGVTVRGFPAGGALKRPMFVATRQTGAVLHGIDAATGEFKYVLPFVAADASSFSFDHFASGASPANDLLAYTVQDSNSGEKSVVFRAIHDGALHLHVQMNVRGVKQESFAPFGWGPSPFSATSGKTLEQGSISMPAFSSVLNGYGALTIDATTGAAEFVKVDLPAHATPTYGNPVVNFGNAFTVGVASSTAGSPCVTFVYGVPANRTTTPSFIANIGSYSASAHQMRSGVSSFSFEEDGASGLASFVWWAEFGVQAQGLFSVYRL